MNRGLEGTYVILEVCQFGNDIASQAGTIFSRLLLYYFSI